jgi:hypothetical protein
MWALLAAAGLGLVAGVLAGLFGVGGGILFVPALTLALSITVPLIKPGLALDLTASSLAKVALMALGIGSVAAVLPIRQIAGLDPANLVKGWANPVTKGDFGPYATIATAAGGRFSTCPRAVATRSLAVNIGDLLWS